MRIYYFGELIEENGVKVAPETKKETKQIEMKFEKVIAKPDRDGMQSIGDILKDLDLTIDSFRPKQPARRVLA